MNWINKHWANFGGIVAIGIIAMILLKGILNIQSLIWIHFAILLFYQFEEYTFPGNFKNFYNTHIWNKNSITKHELNDKGILAVNVALAWTIYLIAAIVVQKMIWLTIGLSGVTIFNGIMHTVMYFKLRKYNPGLITGLFTFIPFGIFLLLRISEYGGIGNWIAGIFVFGAALIPTTIRLTNRDWL